MTPCPSKIQIQKSFPKLETGRRSTHSTRLAGTLWTRSVPTRRPWRNIKHGFFGGNTNRGFFVARFLFGKRSGNSKDLCRMIGLFSQVRIDMSCFYRFDIESEVFSCRQFHGFVKAPLRFADFIMGFKKPHPIKKLDESQRKISGEKMSPFRGMIHRKSRSKNRANGRNLSRWSRASCFFDWHFCAILN